MLGEGDGGGGVAATSSVCLVAGVTVTPEGMEEAKIAAEEGP